MWIFWVIIFDSFVYRYSWYKSSHCFWFHSEWKVCIFDINRVIISDSKSDCEVCILDTIFFLFLSLHINRVLLSDSNSEWKVCILNINRVIISDSKVNVKGVHTSHSLWNQKYTGKTYTQKSTLHIHVGRHSECDIYSTVNTWMWHSLDSEYACAWWSIWCCIVYIYISKWMEHTVTYILHCTILWYIYCTAPYWCSVVYSSWMEQRMEPSLDSEYMNTHSRDSEYTFTVNSECAIQNILYCTILAGK